MATTKLGSILVDGKGSTVYLFVPDRQSDSTCYDRCEKTWPTLGKATGVGAGLDATKLGTTTRKDGSIQATYNGWPHRSDNTPGDLNGQALGDAWYVLDATGKGVS